MACAFTSRGSIAQVFILDCALQVEGLLVAAIESAAPEIDILASLSGNLTLKHMKDMGNNDRSPFGARGLIRDVE